MPGRCVCQSSHELVRREIVEARMRTHLVVVPPPRLDDHLRLGTRTKPFEAQALVAELAVEALRDAILPRLAGLDQCGADALRRKVGAPRALTRRDSTSMTRGERMRQSTSIASPSLVN